MHRPFPQWLQEKNQKCKNFFTDTLPEKKLPLLPNYDHIKNITYDQLYDTLMEADPQQGKNCIWLFLQFKRGQFRLEDINRVRDDLILFLTNNTKIDRKFRKLGSIDYRKLKELIQPFEEHAEINFVSVPNEDYIVLYHGPYGQLYQVLTQKGSCSLGSGTKWCTAARNDNMFADFNRYGHLFIWYDNDTKKKYQFHFQTNSYMDEQDNEIDSDLLTYFVIEHPVLKKFFLSKMIDAIDHRKFLFLPPIKTRWLAVEPYIKYDPYYAYKYALNILKSEWPAAEPYIMQVPDYAYLYALNILRSEWPAAEPYIMYDPECAYKYASKVLKSEWPEAEPYIMENPQYAYEYALNILKREWPAAEPYIMKNPEYGYLYAKNVLKREWPAAEPYIMENPQYAYEYALNILKREWPEAEPYIMQDPQFSSKYAEIILDPQFSSEDTEEILEPYITQNLDDDYFTDYY